MTSSCPVLSRCCDRCGRWKAEYVFDFGEEGFRCDWLGDEIGSTGFEAGVTGELAGKAAHDDDRSRSGDGVLPERFANDEAVQAGQQEVEEDNIRSEGDGFLDGIMAVRCGSDNETVALEIEAQEAKKVFIIVNQQNLLSHTQAGQPQNIRKKRAQTVPSPKVPNSQTPQ
jgi:hypothetical protein